jgi:hypothetical protein
MLLWMAFYASFCIAQQDGPWEMFLVAALSPVFIISTLLFLSGMTLLEANANKRYGPLPAYREYRRNTSCLIPMPPSMWQALPACLQHFLFEWDMYKVNLDESLRNQEVKASSPELQGNSAEAKENAAHTGEFQSSGVNDA